MSVSRVLDRDLARAALALGFGIAAALVAREAAGREAVAAIMAHAAWCVAGENGAGPGVATALGHCGLCWSAATLAFGAGAALGLKPR